MEQEIARCEEMIDKKDTSFESKTSLLAALYYFDPQKHSVSSLHSYPLLIYQTNFVPMSLSQMLEYLRKQKKSIQIGDIEVVTAGSQLRTTHALENSSQLV